MRARTMGIAAGSLLLLVACTGTANDAQYHDPALLEAIIEDTRVGWEQGDGEKFYAPFLDWEGARYFEGGGQNLGLQDLVVNHVEPESELGLTLGFSDIQTHFEGTFAWAVVDTEVELTTGDGRNVHNTGHGTYLFRLVDGAWKVVHTQSASRPVSPLGNSGVLRL